MSTQRAPQWSDVNFIIRTLPLLGKKDLKLVEQALKDAKNELPSDGDSDLFLVGWDDEKDYGPAINIRYRNMSKIEIAKNMINSLWNFPDDPLMSVLFVDDPEERFPSNVEFRTCTRYYQNEECTILSNKLIEDLRYYSENPLEFLTVLKNKNSYYKFSLMTEKQIQKKFGRKTQIDYDNIPMYDSDEYNVRFG